MNRISRGGSNRIHYANTRRKSGKNRKYIKYPEVNQFVVNCYAPCEYHPKPEYYDQRAYCPQSPYYENKSEATTHTKSTSRNRQSNTYTIKSTRISPKATVPYMTKYPNPLYTTAVSQAQMGAQPEQYQEWQQAQQWQHPQQWQWLRVQQQLQQNQQWQQDQLTLQDQQRNQQLQQNQQNQFQQASQQQHNWQSQQSPHWSHGEQWPVTQTWPPSQATTIAQCANYLRASQHPAEGTKFLKEQNPNVIKRISPEFMALLKKHEKAVSKLKIDSTEI